jgi:diaminopimelate epimerase
LVRSALGFVKGHGTQNDFVLVPDIDGDVDLSPSLVAALCDRRVGIGGDGLIRVVRSAALPDGVAQAGEAEWFMDYRNADGSPAEMCGNGVRVFARYLTEAGLVRLADGDEVRVGTRAGVKRVRLDGDGFAVDLGSWRVVGGEAAAVAGSDATVILPGERLGLPGLSVNTGNPHVVVALPDGGRLAAADLSRPPAVEPAPPLGTNVELVVPVPDAHAHLLMRVHERGVGETRSCGTGTVAAALAARVWAGDRAPDDWEVCVPGGRLQVRVPHGQLLAGSSVELSGPAVLVADGTVDLGRIDITRKPAAAVART